MANRNQDDLDRALDAALAKYAAEPRAGLEERVLANLRAETARESVRAWWQWSVLAALAAAAVIAVALSWRTGSHPTTPVAVTTPTTQPAGTHEAGSGKRSGVRLKAARGTRRTPKHRAAVVVPVAAPQRLDQFPSPQPLSEQEKLLRAFVAEDPERAVLIARARSEQLRQDELEKLKLFPSGNERMERNSDTTER